MFGEVLRTSEGAHYLGTYLFGVNIFRLAIL